MSLACDHFFSLPSSIKWDNRLADVCPVTNQKKRGSCRAVAAAELYTYYLKHNRWLQSDEYLAYGYYYGQLAKARVKSDNTDYDFGDSFKDFTMLLKKYAIVTQKHYQNDFTDFSESTFKYQMQYEAFMLEIYNSTNKSDVIEKFFTLSNIQGTYFRF